MDYYQLKELLINAIETVLSSQLLGSVGGIVGIIAGFALAFVFRNYLKPVIQLVFRKIHAMKVESDTRKKIKKIEEAKTDEEFDKAVDDLFK